MEKITQKIVLNHQYLQDYGHQLIVDALLSLATTDGLDPLMQGLVRRDDLQQIFRYTPGAEVQNQDNRQDIQRQTQDGCDHT